MTPVVAVNSVTINLGGRPVVKQVDLTVDVGEFVAVLGTNGSGKSTLVRACIGLVPIDAGSIELFGTPLAKFKSWHRLGYLPQRSNATSGVPATVYEVVMSGRLARRRFFGGRNQADLEAVIEAVERVGLTDRLRDSVTELSGGQQQRVLIARALAAQAELLIMDEPTAGVDHANQESLAELLGEGFLVGMVHARSRLVHDEQFGLCGQRPGDEDPLLLSAGQFGHRIAESVGKPDPFDGFNHGFEVGLVSAAEEPTTREAPTHHHLIHGGGDPGRRIGTLREVAEAMPGFELRQGSAE